MSQVNKKPLSSDFIQVLVDVERLFPVDKWEVAGIRVWPLLRVRWAFSEWQRFYANGTPQGSVSNAGRLKRLLQGTWAVTKSAFAGYGFFPTVVPKADVLFLSDGVSLSNLGGTWIERFCDPLQVEFQRQHCATHSLMVGYTIKERYKFKPTLVQPLVDLGNLLGGLKAKVMPGVVHLPAHGEVISYLQARGFSAGELAVAVVVSCASRIRTLTHVYRYYLRRSQAKAGFCVGYYGVEGMAFMNACRKQGIPAVDIQHGVQGEAHFSYASWVMTPRITRYDLLPSHFWVWSDWEKRVIDGWCSGSEHIALKGGNPWMHVWNPDAPWSETATALESARQLRAAYSKPIILVTLQYGFHDDEQIAPLQDLIKGCAGKYAFWIRLHPVMLSRREEIRHKLCLTDDVVIDASSDLPLQSLLGQADLHMTHSSSSVIEAEQFGLTSILTSNFGRDVFESQIANGLAIYEPGPVPALLSCIDACLTRRKATGKFDETVSAAVSEFAKNFVKRSKTW